MMQIMLNFDEKVPKLNREKRLIIFKNG